VNSLPLLPADTDYHGDLQILFLNKNDLFEKKVQHSPIKNFFPDYEGEPGDPRAGRDYFKRRFARLAQKANAKEREIYIHITTATDTAMLRVVMAAVEDIILRHNLLSINLI
jgi:guanine nucleotide-binding protein subunit alpha